MKNILWTFKLGVKSRPYFIIGIFMCYIMMYLLSPLSTILIKSITDELILESTFSITLLILVFLYIIIISFENVQYSFSMLFIENLDNSLAKKVQGALFEVTYKLDLKKLDDSIFLTKLYRARNITWYVFANILNNLFHSFGQLVSIMVSIILIINESTLLVVPIVVLCILQNIMAKKRVEELIVKDQKVDSIQRKQKYDLNLLISKDSLREVRVDDAYNFIFNKWRSKFQSSADIEREFLKRWAIKDSLIQMVSIFIDSILFIILATFVIQGLMSIGTFILVINNKSIITSGISSLVEQWIDLKDDDSYIKDLREILDEDNTFNLVSPNKDMILEMNKVHFSYKEDIVVLKDINLCLKKGQLVAIVGENGCGKSTLAKVALGLLEAQYGIVKLDVNDISAAYQDFVKFEMSLRENIGLGHQRYLNKNKMIKEAIYKGDSKDVYEIVDENLAAILGKHFDVDGFELSGGQWQRIAVSRSFMGNHKFIVFDEPASNLDPLAEKRQFQHIKSQLSEMGGLIISHRVGIARLADYIVFLKEGQIVESGSHEELISKDSYYKTFFDAQAQWYQED